MKLRMSENSLFAILLRAKWWVSLVVAAAFATLAAALLPQAYVPVGVLGATPFLVIGVVAAWRQRHAPSAEALEQMRSRMAAMAWRDFADVVEKACVARGFTVTRLSGQAADFHLEKAGTVTLLSARRWKAANQGAEPLRELAGAMQAQQASSGMYLSVAPASESAQRLAKDEGIALVSGNALALWLLV